MRTAISGRARPCNTRMRVALPSPQKLNVSDVISQLDSASSASHTCDRASATFFPRLLVFALCVLLLSGYELRDLGKFIYVAPCQLFYSKPNDIQRASRCGFDSRLQCLVVRKRWRKSSCRARPCSTSSWTASPRIQHGYVRVMCCRSCVYLLIDPSRLRIFRARHLTPVSRCARCAAHRSPGKEP